MNDQQAERVRSRVLPTVAQAGGVETMRTVIVCS
jgi:hypothetical protein